MRQYTCLVIGETISIRSRVTWIGRATSLKSLNLHMITSPFFVFFLLTITKPCRRSTPSSRPPSSCRAPSPRPRADAATSEPQKQPSQRSSCFLSGACEQKGPRYRPHEPVRRSSAGSGCQSLAKVLSERAFITHTNIRNLPGGREESCTTLAPTFACTSP